MYGNHFVVCLMAEGKYLREKDGVVELPFGTEYTLYLKNLYTRDGVARIRIDGADVLDGKSIIVPAGKSVEVEGFLQNTEAKNHFRFIEKTDRIREHRGEHPEDGLVTVEFQFEKQWAYVSTPHNVWWTYTSTMNDPITLTDSHTWTGEGYTSSCSTAFISGENQSAYMRYIKDAISSAGVSETKTQDGITVKGSPAHQHFDYGYVGSLETDRHVITLKLVGYTPQQEKVVRLTTTREKIICPTCGTANASSQNYCGECGTWIK